MFLYFSFLIFFCGLTATEKSPGAIRGIFLFNIFKSQNIAAVLQLYRNCITSITTIYINASITVAAYGTVTKFSLFIGFKPILV